MELEHELMKSVMRIAYGGRRRPLKPENGCGHKHHGYGRILDLLSKTDGLTQKEIAEALDIRPQSASEAITSMENQNLIRKVESEQDKRAVLVYITQAGRKRQIDLREEFVRNAQRVFAPLNEEEKETLQTLLNKVAAALQENKEEC